MSLSIEGAKAALSTMGSSLATGGAYLGKGLYQGAGMIGNGLYSGASALGNGLYSGASALGNGLYAAGSTVGNGFIYAGSAAKTFGGNSYVYLKPVLAGGCTWAAGPGAGVTFAVAAVVAFAITEFPSLHPQQNDLGVSDNHKIARRCFKVIALGCAIAAGVVMAVGPQSALAIASTKASAVHAFVKAAPYVGRFL